MYLKFLNKAQKELALDLLIHASLSNNNMDDLQKTLIDQYCDEMEVETRFAANLDGDEAMRQLAEISDKATLRKVLIELTALVMSDMELDDLEKSFMKKYAALTGFSQSEFREVCYLLEGITRYYQRLEELINSAG